MCWGGKEEGALFVEGGRMEVGVVRVIKLFVSPKFMCWGWARSRGCTGGRAGRMEQGV